MKKIALLMALLMLMLSFAACGKKTETPNGAVATGAGDEAIATEETGVGAEVEAAQGNCQHQYDAEVVSTPNCTEIGITNYTCALCQHSYTEEVPAMGHEAESATCEEASICATCEQIVEAALGHEDENGVCKNCGMDMPAGGATTATESTETTEESETVEATVAQD